MVGHGGSSAGSYLAGPTSPIPSHCASTVTTSTVRVHSTMHHIYQHKETERCAGAEYPALADHEEIAYPDSPTFCSCACCKQPLKRRFTTVTLVYVHVEVTVNWCADIARQKRTHGAKRSINLLKKDMKNIFPPCSGFMTYRLNLEVLISDSTWGNIR